MLTNKQTATAGRGWGARPCPTVPAVHPPSRLPACLLLIPHRDLELPAALACLFLLWKSGVGGEGKIVELYINLSELKVEFGFQFLHL